MSIRIRNLNQFNKDLQRFARKAEIAPKAAAQKITFEVFDMIVKGTPVDTGYARANWNVNTKAPDTSTLEKSGFQGKNVSAANRANETQRNNINEPSTRYYITNNVPYIIYLEEPTLTDKPTKKGGRMVRRAISTAGQRLRFILKELD